LESRESQHMPLDQVVDEGAEAGHPKRACGISRYVLWRPDKQRWWFRRRVPGYLVAIIGKPEWRRTLAGRSRADAEHEAIPVLDETNRIIALAERGNWPPISDDTIDDLSLGWWRLFQLDRSRQIRNSDGSFVWPNGRDRLDDIEPKGWALASEDDLSRSVRQFLTGAREWRHPQAPDEIRDRTEALLCDPKRLAQLLKQKDAMARLMRQCRILHHEAAGGYLGEGEDRNGATSRILDMIEKLEIDPRQLLAAIEGRKYLAPTHAPAAAMSPVPTTPLLPVKFNDTEGDDLIAKWATWRKVRPKTVYEARRIMRKLTDFVGQDDLTRLARADIERWIEHLDQQGAAPKTVAGHLLTLKTLTNFAVEKEILADSPATRVNYRAKPNPRTKIRAYRDHEARTVLEATRREDKDYMRWIPWICCFTGARLDEVAGAARRDVERVGRYWTLNIRLDHRAADASIKNVGSERRVPLHPKLIEEGFLDYVNSLPKDGPLFPSLRPDKFGSKAGTATKKIGPFVRALGIIDKRLSPNHSWRHRLIEEFRRIPVREDIEHAITGHSQEGTAPDYGEYSINTMLGPAIDQTRSPFDIRSEDGDADKGNFVAVAAAD